MPIGSKSWIASDPTPTPPSWCNASFAMPGNPYADVLDLADTDFPAGGR